MAVGGGESGSEGPPQTVVRPSSQGGAAWRDSFPIDTATLATVGQSRYFVLRPGYRLTLEGTERRKGVVLVVTVLDETRNVGGVETRVVEERETRGGVLEEVSRNFFAVDPKGGDLYYLGEEVDDYRGGKVVGHEGSWAHGARGARFGLAIPGRPALGERYYQEIAPKVAMDRAKVTSLTARVATPAGTFEGCLVTDETTPLEPGAHESKAYAPGVGLVRDGALLLTERTPAP